MQIYLHKIWKKCAVVCSYLHCDTDILLCSFLFPVHFKCYFPGVDFVCIYCCMAWKIKLPLYKSCVGVEYVI